MHVGASYVFFSAEEKSVIEENVIGTLYLNITKVIMRSRKAKSHALVVKASI